LDHFPELFPKVFQGCLTFTFNFNCKLLFPYWPPRWPNG